MTVLGKDLKIGDTINVWWAPGRDTIIGLRPYHGPLSSLWQADGGARIATMALLPSKEFTIEPGADFTLTGSDNSRSLLY